MLKGFKEFIMRGNVVDLAVGIVVGGAFGTVIDSFTNHVLMAIIGAVAGKPNFNDLSFKIGKGVIGYGYFITAVVNFLIVASALYFFVVAPLNALASRRRAGQEEDVEPTNEERVVALLEEIASQGRN